MSSFPPLTLTTEDVIEWANLTGLSTEQTAVLDGTISAAVAALKRHTVEWTEGEGTDEYNDRMACFNLAASIQAHAWWSRSSSPSGFAGYGPNGEVARLVGRSLDPDVITMVEEWWDYGVAGPGTV